MNYKLWIMNYELRITNYELWTKLVEFIFSTTFLLVNFYLAPPSTSSLTLTLVPRLALDAFDRVMAHGTSDLCVGWQLLAAMHPLPAGRVVLCGATPDQLQGTPSLAATHPANRLLFDFLLRLVLLVILRHSPVHLPPFRILGVCYENLDVLPIVH